MTLGERIYRYRKDKKMSQNDLANELEVSRQSISKWETNASIPELNKLIRMSEVFRVSLDELVQGEKAVEAKREFENYNKTNQKPGLSRRKILGIILLGIGIIVFMFWWILLDPINALIFTSPFFACGIICLTIRKHTVLWCFWAIFIIVYGYLRYTTGIRFWWIFLEGIYRDGMEIHAVIAWLMSLSLAVLIIVTSRLFFKKWKNRQIRGD